MTPRFPFIITASDESRGVMDAAKRRMASVKRAAEEVGGAIDRLSSPGRLGRITTIARTFGKVEKSISSALGYRSPLADAAARFGGVKAAAGELSGTIGALGRAGRAAAADVGAMSGVGVEAAASMSRLGVAGAAAAAGVAAAGYAAFKISDNWSRGANALGKLSTSLNMATRDVQTLQQAAKRLDIDEAATNNSLGQFSYLIYEQQYGRADKVRNTMAKLNIRDKRDAKGNIDRMAMLEQVADAMSTAKDEGAVNQIAEIFGVTKIKGLLRKGGKNLRREMADAERYAPVITEEETRKGAKNVDEYTKAGQLKDRPLEAAASAIASGVGVATAALNKTARGAYDLIRGDGDQGGVSGFAATARNVIAPAAGDIRDGGRSILDAAKRLELIAPIGALGGVIAGSVGAFARDRAKATPPAGVTGKGLALSGGVAEAAAAAEQRWNIPRGIIAAQYQLESGGGRHMPPGSNNPFGHKAAPGEPFVEAMTTEVIDGVQRRVKARFRKYDSVGEAFEVHAKKLATSRHYAGARAQGDDPDAFADALTGKYATDPGYGTKLKAIMHQQVSHHHTFSGLPTGTRIRSETGSDVSVNHAMIGGL